MGKTIKEAVEEMERDVTRWRAERASLLAEGHPAIAQQLDPLIEAAEKLISQWEQLQ